MKTLTVNRLACGGIRAADIPALMAESGTVYNKVDCANWAAEYPYRPDVEFALAHSGDAFLLHFRVEEQSVRAVAAQDNGRIWEDSCVEFFLSPCGDGLYYNIECNCTGHLLVGGGRVKPDRGRSSMQVMAGVDRWASLGNGTFDTREGLARWEVALRIPLSTFFLHDITSLQGRTMRANFYKCGDLLPVPHFVSWNAIGTERPDFHRPEFFGELRME